MKDNLIVPEVAPVAPAPEMPRFLSNSIQGVTLIRFGVVLWFVASALGFLIPQSKDFKLEWVSANQSLLENAAIAGVMAGLVMVLAGGYFSLVLARLAGSQPSLVGAMVCCGVMLLSSLNTLFGFWMASSPLVSLAAIPPLLLLSLIAPVLFVFLSLRFAGNVASYGGATNLEDKARSLRIQLAVLACAVVLAALVPFLAPTLLFNSAGPLLALAVVIFIWSIVLFCKYLGLFHQLKLKLLEPGALVLPL